MATNSIKIYDDTVIKISVNQGLEEQRSNEVLGNFTNGELAFTRDTGRLFVGDNSDGEPGHIGLQETVGGSLVGNKYLGLIDSKPLVTFANNGEPLSFEATTSSTGTQELSQFSEPGLLTASSKFRLHSPANADEVWHNWDRTAVYNPKYNAYNGDFMYDVYQNALILFDTRISGNPESATQPQIKKGSDGRPVTPETFIVNGKEISSSNTQALNLTRRTILQNYSKTNDDVTNSELVYGDGYVVLRMVEPDNQTIRFKQKSFQQNGQPIGENNYTHNLLEIFHVPTSALAGAFSDDFIMGEQISLNKNLAYINSITSPNNNLELPGTLSFSTSASGGRSATTFVQWAIKEPKGVTIPTDDTYKLKFTPKAQLTDNGKKYFTFDAELEVEKPCAYTINLDGGLESNQANPNTLIIDEDATYEDITLCPTLRMGKIEKEVVLYNEDSDPYLTDKDGPIYYAGNLGIDPTGAVRNIDEFDAAYYPNALDKINKWEEQNTPINFIKTPVTILQSSTSSTLYQEGEEVYTATPYSLPSNVTATASATITNGKLENLVKLATSANSLSIAKNTGTGAPTNNVTLVNNVLAIPSVTTDGLGVVFVGQALPIKKYIKQLSYTGQIVGLVGTGTVRVFCALIANGKLIKYQERQSSYKNFNFGFDIALDEVLISGNTFFAIGAIFDGATSNVKITYSNVATLDRSVQDEEIFTLSDIGVNVNVDFNVSPYVFCAKKTVSSPNTAVLPQITNVSQYTNNPRSTYFNSFSALHNKTWNNLVTVLGHNHFKDLSDTYSEIPMYYGYDSPVKNACFKFVNSLEVNNEEEDYQIVKHTEIKAGDEEYMAFSWYKEYSKSDTGTEENVRYYPHEDFDRRGEDLISEYNEDITYIKIQGNETNLIGTGSINGIIAGAEEVLAGGLYRKQYALYWDSPLLINDRQDYIEYGSNDLRVRYDFKKFHDLGFSYKEYIDSEVKEVVFIKEGSPNVAFEEDTLKSIFPNNIITIDTNLAPDNSKVGTFDYMIIVYQEVIPTTGVAPDEDVEPEYAEAYDVFKILKNVPYLTCFNEPKSLGSVQIVNSNNTNTLASVTLDETVDEEDKVFIPTHARSIILEMTHLTTENNTIGIMYANKFEDLGVLLPGLPVQEYNNPTSFSADVIINPSHISTMVENNYVTANGKTKMKLGKSTSSVDATGFHDLTKTLEENKKRIPSIYAAAPNEKILCNSSTTETRVLEVPLHTVPGTDTRHFALRLANIRPSNTEILNQVVLRVIGYRV